MGKLSIVLPLPSVCYFPVHNEYMADRVENSSDVTCLPGYVAPHS
jgi:hypothetical protein